LVSSHSTQHRTHVRSTKRTLEDVGDGRVLGIVGQRSDDEAGHVHRGTNEPRTFVAHECVDHTTHTGAQSTHLEVSSSTTPLMDWP
jgi:hypothetical protein